MSTHFLPPSSLLACPHCGTAASAGGFEPQNRRCHSCGQTFFDMAGLPCWFPNGPQQKALWQHQLGLLQHQGEQGLAQLHESLSRYDLTDLGRARLAQAFQANRDSLEHTLALFAEAGVTPEMNAQFGQMNPGEMTEYYDLILRDWAWDDGTLNDSTLNDGTLNDGAIPRENRTRDENQVALERVLSVYPSTGTPPGNLLVIGAGAGRLSWDLHCRLRPDITLALDSNPLLLLAAHRLIRQRQPLTLAELKPFPQIDKPTAARWSLDPPDDPDTLRDRWFALAANAWAPPLQEGQFDLIVTPWFIDVNGGDFRDTVALIHRLLKPGGRWLNTGPLLFLRSLPYPLKYQDTEIREFLALSGFTLEQEQVNLTPHLVSPLEARWHCEQVWSFCARLPSDTEGTPASAPGALAPWLILHHLPVPRQPFRVTQQHPLIDAILALVDGERSLLDIAAHIAPQLPEGLSARDAVVTLFGQLLTEAAP